MLSLVSVKKSCRFLRSCLSISSGLLWYYWLEESSDPLKFPFQSSGSFPRTDANTLHTGIALQFTFECPGYKRSL